MPSDSRLPIVIFAQVPPPEHGQSRMVSLGLEALLEHPEHFEVHHVNARFSSSLEDIGESSLYKTILISRYLVQAIRIWTRVSVPILYYVPGPAKWSSVLRDWVILTVLRLFYSRVVFHWHAIGHGEWAHGSNRLTLEGPRWLDRVARKISARVLNEPFASIAVCSTSRKDSHSVGSLRQVVVCNGIKDPCQDFDQNLWPLRDARQVELAAAQSPCFRILFLSHGTLEKGILDVLTCLAVTMEHADPSWKFDITFAGGVSETVRSRFDAATYSLVAQWPTRIRIIEKDYVTGDAKQRCFVENDIFLAPSRWESFGLTVLEAMAYGMPIVAVASDGVRGVLPDNYPYLSLVGNTRSLAANLLACCSTLKSGEDQEAGRALRMRFLENYQIKDFSGNLIQTFLKLGTEVANSGSPSPLLELNRSAPRRCDFFSSIPPGNRHRSLHVSAYLADQNPGYDRSFGISRMSQVVLEALQTEGDMTIEAIASRTSQQAPESIGTTRILPWGTRRKSVRLLTDHFHPLFGRKDSQPDLHYFPKGYLPLLHSYCSPSVVTIHDTIIQYDEDHYPKWRKRWEYTYWALMLKHTLRSADRILTVSESSRNQIRAFMQRHRIPEKEITVTYEPCLYEGIPQPADTHKENYVIHLASCEPHKRTAHLVRWWHDAEERNQDLPMLHLIGTVPPEVESIVAGSRSIVKRPFLEDAALQAAYQEARALILPSEIEGFGLPALEAYYVGTPVCFVIGTSVEEILGVATDKGGFSLDSPESLFAALHQVMNMNSAEIRECGLKLRETYAAEKVAKRMIQVFQQVAFAR